MKRFVNGEEVELDDSATVTRLSDRLIVHTPEGAFSAVAVRQGDAVLVSYKGNQYKVEKKQARARHHGAASSGELRAPMPGLIVDVRVEKGQTVEKGDTILVLEAMKTQQPFTAPFNGTVKELNVAKGDQVNDGQLLALIEEA
ncbi:MAG: acetyl-CoA carboxylase biotin carboxyl carrier protein subunit [Fimbriimonas sp.]